MKQIQELIEKTKTLRQYRQPQQAITILNQAHNITVHNLSAKELVDVHNELFLLYYLNNDYNYADESFKFIYKLINRINYNDGLVEALIYKKRLETENKKC